ncbi:two-component system sensor kinase [Streptomyces sp. e14]|nr:two-component system sensor kinase [Streptomyces sp. e14]
MLPHRTPLVNSEGRHDEHAPAQDQWQEQGDRRSRRGGRGGRRRARLHRHRAGGRRRRRVHEDQRLVDRLHRAVRRHQRQRPDGEGLDAGVRPAGGRQARLAVERRVHGQRPARHREAGQVGHRRARPRQDGHRRLRRGRQRRPDRLPDRRRLLFRGRRRHPRAQRPPHPDRHPHPRPPPRLRRRPATSTPTPTASQSTGTGTGTGTTATAGFAPYVDTSLYPAFDLLASADATGVKNYNLAFVTDGGGCTPKWGGVTDLASDAVAAQIGALRAKGGDVRVSFGGASGSELATTCTSADALAAAYGKAVDQYKLTKVDFDVEGGALPNTAANTRRAQAIAKLQQQHPGLDVSFTLPVMPEGLTQDGVNLLANAKTNGVKISTVNIMAMDYGASYNGDMGAYAEQAATATQAQIKSVLALSDSAAWKTVAVTPMIGVNDVSSEVFKVDDATQLVNFAKSKGLGWLSMWSATRDKQCAGGAKPTADATCSSVTQDAYAFSKAFGAYN